MQLEARRVEPELSADVLLVEAATLSDPAARKAVDWAGAGVATVVLVRNPAVETVVEALRAGIKAVLPSGMDRAEIVAAGLGNKEVASRLEISEHTVKFHVASIMGKLGAASRTEAVTLAIRHGLIME